MPCPQPEVRSKANTPVFYPSSQHLALATCRAGESQERKSEFCCFNGVRRRDQGRLGNSRVWKTWSQGGTRRGDAPASPTSPHTVIPQSLQAFPWVLGAPPPLSIPCPFPSEIPRPTHRHHNLGATAPAPNSGLSSRAFRALELLPSVATATTELRTA